MGFCSILGVGVLVVLAFLLTMFSSPCSGLLVGGILSYVSGSHSLWSHSQQLKTILSILCVLFMITKH